MLLATLNFLQNLLLPLLLAALVVGGLLVYLVGRKPRRPQPPAARPAADQPAGLARAPQQGSTADAPGSQAMAGRLADAATEADAAVAARAAADVEVDPMAVAGTAAPAPPAPPCPPTAGPPSVADLLLVDDSAVVRAKLRRLFAPAGYRMALASDGAEALALLGQGRYGLLVTDLEMPKLDGVGLIRAALALPACQGMPILAITGHEDLQSQLNQLHAVAGIYRKPWIDDDLLSHVQALVQPSTLPALATEDA